ncbi:MAG: SUKH-3 domain-containing protein [Planctomycetota bacterium]|nr:SUKH-3 domain-containing protein [Planctomycetota bacterium]
MNAHTIECLVRAGWKPGRKVDVSASIDLLKQKDFLVNDVIVSFLAEFLSLTIRYPNPRCPSTEDNFCIQPEDSIAGSGGTWTQTYERRLGERLCPLGEACRGHLTLYMSSTGKVYAGTDDLLYFLGDSVIPPWMRS